MGFRQATFYLAELFRQATFYLAELFRQIASLLFLTILTFDFDSIFGYFYFLGP